MNYNVIKPKYYDKFFCINKDCEDVCCYGWDIIIDKETFDKYRSVDSPEFKSKQEKFIKRVEGGNASDLNYAKFELNEENRCPFQTKEGLCEIHRDYGEEYLCYTCRSYPRIRRAMTEDFAELSVSMSCPEAARTALFIEDGIEFIAETKTYTEGDPDAGVRLRPKQGEKATDYLQYGWEMREAAITIMQKRDCPIEYRLIIIAMMLDEVVHMHDEGKHGGIPGALEFYRDGTYGEQFIAGFNEIEPDERLQIEINLLLYVQFRENMDEPRNTAFKEFIEHIVQYYAMKNHGAQISEAAMAVTSYYYTKDTVAAHWNGFVEKWGYVLENYLVSYMFSELFPLKHHEQGLSPYHHSFLLAEQFAVLRMLLCGNYDEAEGFSKEFIVKTISQVAVLNQHTTDPLKIVQNYRDIGIDTPAHLYYLLF